MTVTPLDAKLRGRREAALTALLDAQNRHDLDASLACFEHPRYELVGNQRVYEGHDEVFRYYRATHEIFPDLHFEVIHLFHSEDAVVAELWMSGTHMGSRADFEATGNRFRCRMAAVFSFTGAALTGVRIYYDTGTIARQLVQAG